MKWLNEEWAMQSVLCMPTIMVITPWGAVVPMRHTISLVLSCPSQLINLHLGPDGGWRDMDPEKTRQWKKHIKINFFLKKQTRKKIAFAYKLWDSGSRNVKKPNFCNFWKHADSAKFSISWPKNQGGGQKNMPKCLISRENPFQSLNFF